MQKITNNGGDKALIAKTHSTSNQSIILTDPIANQSKQEECKPSNEGQSKTIDTIRAEGSLILGKEKKQNKFKIIEEDITPSNQLITPSVVKEQKEVPPIEQESSKALADTVKHIDVEIEQKHNHDNAESKKEDKEEICCKGNSELQQSNNKEDFLSASLRLNNNERPPKKKKNKKKLNWNAPREGNLFKEKVSDGMLNYLLELEKIKQESLVQISNNFCKCCMDVVKAQINRKNNDFRNLLGVMKDIIQAPLEKLK